MNRRLIPYLLLSPAIVIYITFSFIPLAGVFRLSFFRTNFIRSEWVGLGNYLKLFTDDQFLSSLWNSVLYVILGVPTHLFIAVAVSLLIYNTSEKWQTYSKTLIYLPSFIGPIILSAVWAWIWHSDSGLVNNILGIRVPWFTSRWVSIPPIVVSATVSGFGGTLVIFSAILKGVSKESIDAARVDGASWRQIKTRILLPAMYPAIVLLSLLQTAGMFQLFYWIELLAPFEYAGSLMWRMYKTSFIFGKWGRGSAYSVVLMFIILAVAIVQRRLMRRAK